MRVDFSEKERLDKRKALFREKFSKFLGHIPDEARETYWGQVEVLYVPFYSLEETLAPHHDPPGETNSLLAMCERITSYLTQGSVTQYSRRRPNLKQEHAAEAVFSQLSEVEQIAAQRLFGRLVRVSRP